jgi:hypothetical protein
VSPIETVAFAVLWVVLLSLAALVLLLYRQVEKAYQQSTAVASNPLPPGTTAPDIDVVYEGQIRPLDFPADGDALLVFVTSTCDACRSLLRWLASSGDAPPVETIVLITGEGFREFLDRTSHHLTLRWIASPADINQQYRVNLVPMLYLVRDRTILGASNDSSPAAVRALLAEAGAAPQLWGNGARAATADSTPPTADVSRR